MVELKTSSIALENELFKSVYDKTPDYVKNLDLMNFDNEGEFSFVLKREHLKPYDEISNPEGLNLEEWFANYAKEAKVSTAGIRGPQNILFPQDTRFPINLVGIVLATLAKALVAVNRGDNQDSTLNYLITDMGLLAKETMQRELNKRPGRVKILVIPIVLVAVASLFYVIGVHLFTSLTGII